MASPPAQPSPCPAQTPEETILQLALELRAARTEAKNHAAALADANNEISMLHQAEREEQEKQISQVDVEREFMETMIRELREKVDKLKMEKGKLEAENAGLKKKLGATCDLEVDGSPEVPR
ncbi:hypothetical protein LTR97_003901 [Elasticomyces elasticus]|uniref:Uncharacterized protein n=1 Tax=Elasticomyces elasticus TaxID=574655 RepID=A0AAN7WEL6_9PEZI|nr:hypothetical protein LTR97_003901 [Elasticomyces elasticus]